MKKVSYIAIEENALDVLMAKVDWLIANYKSVNSSDSNNLICNDEFVTKLKISKRTAQRLRNEGTITFIKSGRKIYYRSTDVERYLTKHLNKSF